MHVFMTISPLLGWISGDPGNSSDWVFDGLVQFILLVMSTGLWLVICLGEMYLIHFLFSLPMRRVERARLFLDLLAGALQRGQPVEQMILSVAQSRDLVLGIRFHMLAAHVEDGARLAEALRKVPRYLPAQILAMLQAAAKRWVTRRKSCQPAMEILPGTPSAAVRSAVDIISSWSSSFCAGLCRRDAADDGFCRSKIQGRGGGDGRTSLAGIVLLVFDSGGWRLIAAEIALTVLVVGMAVIYISGGRGAGAMDSISRISHRPIRLRGGCRGSGSRRLYRTPFSAMLAVLLDGGVPEAEAVQMAGSDCTANEIAQSSSGTDHGGTEKAESNWMPQWPDSMTAREFRWRLAKRHCMGA